MLANLGKGVLDHPLEEMVGEHVLHFFEHELITIHRIL